MNLERRSLFTSLVLLLFTPLLSLKRLSSSAPVPPYDYLKSEVDRLWKYTTALQDENDSIKLKLKSLRTKYMALLGYVPFGYKLVSRTITEELNGKGWTVVTVYEEIG